MKKLISYKFILQLIIFFYCTAEEEDMLVKQQEGSLLARQKMFVQLRQDLERVSINLNQYLVGFFVGERGRYTCIGVLY